MKGNRTLSYSEISSALTCQAKHAFAYSGHLTGGQVLKLKNLSTGLSNGRAWGAAVAAWHGHKDTLFDLPIDAAWAAHSAMLASYEQDRAEQIELGAFVLPRQDFRLGQMLDQYMEVSPQLPNLTALEGDFVVPVPSRTGRQGSSRYRFQARVDGICVRDTGVWIVEFKLRKRLTDPAQIQLSRQIRWYAWAVQQHLGVPVAGVIVDERLNEAPKLPRLVRAKRKSEGIDGLVPSHAVDQLCRAEDYIDVCEDYGVDPVPATVSAMEQRRWQWQTSIPFRRSELVEAGQELVSAAQTVRDLDSGSRYPVRNAQPFICQGCNFKPICANPEDHAYVQTLYALGVPKRDRGAVVADPSSDARSDRPSSREAHTATPRRLVGADFELVGPFVSASGGSHGSASSAS